MAGGAQLVVLYGRRRIGTTELLGHFAPVKATYLYCEKHQRRLHLSVSFF